MEVVAPGSATQRRALAVTSGVLHASVPVDRKPETPGLKPYMLDPHTLEPDLYPLKIDTRPTASRLQKARFSRGTCPRSCLSESVYKVVLQKSIPAQIRQLILHEVITKDTLTDL